jgi:sialic acid synthase
MRDTTKDVLKPWGSYSVLHEEPGRNIKIITVDPGQSLSLQSHEHRSEIWFVLNGQATVQLDGESQTLLPTQTIEIGQRQKHRLTNDTDKPLQIAELQYGDVVEESDIVRYVDRYGRLVNETENRYAKLESPVTICEVGCNHRGDFDTALEMIKIAAQIGKVDVVKFQKRNNRELLTPDEYDANHPVPANSYGETYGEHREFLEFDIEQHRILKQWCEEWGVVYSSSVWDLASAREIVSLEPQLIKLPSAINSNKPLLNYLFQEYPGEIHISLGMTTRLEETEVVELAEKADRAKDLILYHCISDYPVAVGDLYLLEIQRLISEYGERVKSIGFSGHHNGLSVDVAALALGATHFERHFTLDRAWKGTDHAASLEPEGFRRLVRDLKATKAALHFKEMEILPNEQVQRDKLKKVVPL